jgi:uncharacterized protein (DUF433 family)
MDATPERRMRGCAGARMGVRVMTSVNVQKRGAGFADQAEALPLREGADGAIRVGDSRVLLELVLRAFEDGATPEMIVQRYATVALPDVYAVIAFYLRHRAEVQAYLARRERKAKEVRRKLRNQQEGRSRSLARSVAQRAE